MLLGHLATRRAVRPAIQRLDVLTASVQAMNESGTIQNVPVLGDVDGAPLARALNELLDSQAARAEAQEADVRLLASLFDRSPNGVLVCREDGRIRMLNPAFREMFEPRSEPEGRLPIEVFGVPEVQDLVELALRGEAEDEVRTVPGARAVVLRPILTEGGEVGVLAQDVSRYRAAERARTDFVANVSHELRTPMAALLGYAETLQADLDRMPDDVRPLVEALARNSRRLRDTFEGLMHLARVEARMRELSLEVVRLEPLLVQAVLPAVDAAGRKGLTFELICDPDVGVRTHAEAFDVILSNLAMNAVKYTAEGGIIVRVSRESELVRIDVTDTGIGIDAAHQERIFERFFRVDDGRTREIGGTGLGLAMVKHLALATGARLSVESTPGEGSTFSVRLPFERVE
jgi:two-component system phosphate regulon sensor histidine kinase PhoR